jgi:hypothetical protein
VDDTNNSRFNNRTDKKMILKNIFEIDPNTFGTDESTYFITGKGHWAKIAGAFVNIVVGSTSSGEAILKFRVRTGGATNPTEYISTYKIEVNGVDIPMILDTTKPNEKRAEFGGSHIGWITGKAKVNEGVNTFKLALTRQFGGLENLVEVLASEGGYTKEQLEAAVLQAKINTYTQEQQDAKYNEGIAAGKKIQFEADVIIVAKNWEAEQAVIMNQMKGVKML